jgi:hypothetical protein
MKFSIIIIFIITIITQNQYKTVANFSINETRKKFEKNFMDRCQNFPFYQKHIEFMEYPRNDYLDYIFYDGKHSGGGLGDRLGGLITAYAFAMRTNRTFLITSSDTSFIDSFRPYYPHHDQFTWRDISWTRFMSYHTSYKNSTYHDCVNPKPRQKKCSLECNEPYQLIRFRGNRAYICRWTYQLNTVNQTELYNTLGIDSKKIMECSRIYIRTKL